MNAHRRRSASRRRTKARPFHATVERRHLPAVLAVLTRAGAEATHTSTVGSLATVQTCGVGANILARAGFAPRRGRPAGVWAPPSSADPPLALATPRQRRRR